jgi:hypothetical protein
MWNEKETESKRMMCIIFPDAESVTSSASPRQKRLEGATGVVGWLISVLI